MELTTIYVCNNLQQAKSFAHLVFPNSRKSVDLKDPTQKDEESERGLISCITHGAMSGMVLYLVFLVGTVEDA